MKWLLLIVAVVVVIVGGVAAIGATLPQNHVVSRSARLSVPPDTVWSIITNVADFPKWREDVKSVETVQGAAVFTWRENMSHGKLTFEATTFDAPTHLVAHIVGKSEGFGGNWDYQIQPAGAGSKITITENGEVYNPLFRFMSAYVMGHTATLDKYLTSLAARTGDTYTPGAA
jgi:carbon monoxide dehydrogenase subunit G